MILAVAKALRRVTEGKASAQAEAAEWKRKYELERARNLLLEQRGYNSSCVHVVKLITYSITCLENVILSKMHIFYALIIFH